MSIKIRTTDTAAIPQTPSVHRSSIRARVKQSGITSIIASFLEVPSIPSGRGNPPNALTDFGKGDFCSLRIADKGVTVAHGAEGLKQQIESTGKVTLPLIHQYNEMAKRDLSSSKITELDLRFSQLTPDQLQTILKNNQAITTIHLSGQWVDNNILGIIAALCPKLECLNMSHSSLVNDDGFKLITMGCSNLHTIVTDNCFNFTDQSLEIIASRYPKLLKLSVKRCLISDKGVQAIANNCSSLIYLYVGGSLVGDAGIKTIAANCHQLQHLNISGSLLITDESLVAVAQGCPELELLNIGHCFLITDKGLQALEKRLPKLTYLTLSGCTLVTDRGIISVTHDRRQLQLLLMSACINISDLAILEIANSCQQL